MLWATFLGRTRVQFRQREWPKHVVHGRILGVNWWRCQIIPPIHTHPAHPFYSTVWLKTMQIHLAADSLHSLDRWLYNVGSVNELKQTCWWVA